MATKAELLEEIDKKNKEIKELNQEVEKLERYKIYDNTSNEIKAVHDSFVNSGFTDKQAFELLKITVANSTKRTLF